MEIMEMYIKTTLKFHHTPVRMQRTTKQLAIYAGDDE